MGLFLFLVTAAAAHHHPDLVSWDEVLKYLLGAILGACSAILLAGMYLGGKLEGLRDARVRLAKHSGEIALNSAAVSRSNAWEASLSAQVADLAGGLDKLAAEVRREQRATALALWRLEVAIERRGYSGHRATDTDRPGSDRGPDPGADLGSGPDESESEG